MKIMVLAMGLAALFTGCCNTCGNHPAVVREKIDNCTVLEEKCDVPCVPAPVNIGLDGW